MEQPSTFTFREAVLSSLLTHALIVILILLFPDAFTASRQALLRNPQDANLPIPLEFYEEPFADDPESMILGDAGPLLSSDPRPESLPPAENEEPFSVGNNPNRFMAPPVPLPPSPDPGPEGDEEASEPPPLPRSESVDTGPDNERVEDDGGDATDRVNPDPPIDLPTGPGGDMSRDSAAHGPDGDESTGEGSESEAGESTDKQESLRDALGRLSTGMSGDGGAPLRFDNPVGGLTGPAGGLSFDTKGFNWGPYARRIYWIIWTNWTQGWPPAARAGLAGIVTVRFRIHRDGRITGIQVLDPSGTPAFDTCATLALEASSPLPPLPRDFTKDSEGVTARFLYNTSDR